MTVRLATPDDAGPIAAVHVASWQTAYRAQLPAERLAAIDVGRRVEVWQRHLAASAPPAPAVYIAEIAGVVAGFAHVAPSRDDDAPPSVGELTSIYVHPDCWFSGAGRELMAAAVSSLRAAGFSAATLWVLADNDRAIRFYERAGWHPDGKEQSGDIMGVRLREIRYTTEL